MTEFQTARFYYEYSRDGGGGGGVKLTERGMTSPHRPENF